MGYRELGYKVLNELSERKVFAGLNSVIELGSQDIENDLLDTEFSGLKSNGVERISAKYLYHRFGFTKYSCIDFDGAHGALPFDLNMDIASTYSFTDLFDLVTVMGTAEHVFNQYALFKNVHNLCRNGGVIMVSVPFIGWHNHGFYNYNPKTFYKMSIHNHYDFIAAWVYDSANENLIELKNLDDSDVLNSCISKLSQSLQYQQGLSLTVVLRKTLDINFRQPIDGSIMIKDIADNYSIESRCLSVLRFFGYFDVKKIAIFGSAKAAMIAKDFFDAACIEIVCFVDDFAAGAIQDIPIVKWDKFVDFYQEKCSHIVKGPMQSADIANRPGLSVPVLEMSPEWL